MAPTPTRTGSDMENSPFYVFTRRGDAQPEVEGMLSLLEADGISRDDSGLHKLTHVTRAQMTLVMVNDPEGPLAERLRRAGWDEPGRKEFYGEQS
jgi:hypothetical protein